MHKTEGASPRPAGRFGRAWARGFSHVWICVVAFPLVFLVALLIAAPPRDPGYLLMVWPWLLVLALAGLVFGAAGIAMGAMVRRTLWGAEKAGEVWAWSRTIAISVSLAYALSVVLLAAG